MLQIRSFLSPSPSEQIFVPFTMDDPPSSGQILILKATPPSQLLEQGDQGLQSKRVSLTPSTDKTCKRKKGNFFVS